MNSTGLKSDTTERKNVLRYSDGASWSEKEVLNHYKGWLWSLIRSATVNLPASVWSHLKATRNDLYQEANLALLLCWRKYQTEKINFPFVPYAYKRVHGAIIDGFREHRVRGGGPVYITVSLDDRNDRSYTENHDDQIDLVNAYKRLDRWERTFIDLLYVKGETLKFIGGLAGVTESRVSQVHHIILDKMRGYLAA